MARKLALIIGNSHYQDPNLAKLIAPGEDVNDLAEVLRDLEIGQFDEVQTLLNTSSEEIRLRIQDFFSDKKPDDLLLFYFSGHGVRDDQGRLYLAVQNTRTSRLLATAIGADFVRDAMNASRSKRLVIVLDCCHSGAFAEGSKAATGESVGTGNAFEGTGYGRVVLTATDATQYAWEGDKIIGEADNSVFTHYLIQGLRTGEADVDADGRITLDELYDYVYGQVVAKTPKQTPGKWSYKQQGDMVIARNPKPIVKPAELPADLKTAIESPLANVRVGAVRELDRLLSGSNAGLALSAFEAIKHLVEDDSRSVSTAASSALNAYAEKQHAREAQERAALERADKERAEAERQAALKAEQDRIAAERATQEHVEAERQAAVKAEAERQAAIKAEQERVAKAKAEAERQAALKAEQDRIAAEKTRQAQAVSASLNEEILDTARRAAVSAARLLVQRGPNAGEIFTLQAGVNVIGRTSGAAVRLTDGLISRQHVRLNVAAKHVTLEDLGSANGTFVNDRKISGGTPIPLHDGDMIALGDTVLVLQASGEVPATEPQLSRVKPPLKPVDDQPTRLTTIGGFKPTPLVVTPGSEVSARQPMTQTLSIRSSTLITTLGFGFTYGILSPLLSSFGLAGTAAGAIGLLVLAAVFPWGAMRFAFQKLDVHISWPRTIAIVLAWGLAGIASVVVLLVLPPATLSSSGSFAGQLLAAAVFSVAYGAVGGYLTARLLRLPAPALQLKSTTWGWIIAWMAGIGVMMFILNESHGLSFVLALGIGGALIGAIGGGVMFRQIAQARDSAAVDQSASAVILPRQSAVTPAATYDRGAALRAVVIICGGWCAIWFVGPLFGYSILYPGVLSYAIIGAGSLAVAYLLWRVVPSLKRTPWLLAVGWTLTLIVARQFGITVFYLGTGICGILNAWIVLHEAGQIPLWQYGLIGLSWMAFFFIGNLFLGGILGSVVSGALMVFFWNRARATTSPA